MKHGRKERKNESHNGKMKLRDRRALPEVAAGVSLMISVSDDADEEEDFDDSVDQDLPDLIDISDEENDDEHDENEMNEFEDIKEVSNFLNPFGTRIYSFVSPIANFHGAAQTNKCILFSMCRMGSKISNFIDIFKFILFIFVMLVVAFLVAHIIQI